jgi:hypothetical protein
MAHPLDVSAAAIMLAWARSAATPQERDRWLKATCALVAETGVTAQDITSEIAAARDLSEETLSALRGLTDADIERSIRGIAHADAHYPEPIPCRMVEPNARAQARAAFLKRLDTHEGLDEDALQELRKNKNAAGGLPADDADEDEV